MSVLDRFDVLPGWKARTIGGVATAFVFVNSVLVYNGREPLPESLTVSAGLLIAWAVSMYLHWRRGKRDPMQL